MKHITTEFCGIDVQTYDTSELGRCFVAQGIVGFNNDFIGLSADDVDAFQVPPLVNGQPSTPLSGILKWKLKMVTAFFHFCSHKNGNAIDLSKLDRV